MIKKTGTKLDQPFPIWPGLVRMIITFQGMHIRNNTFKPISFVKKRIITFYNDQYYYTEAILSVFFKMRKAVFFLNTHTHIFHAEKCVTISTALPDFAVFEKWIHWTVYTFKLLTAIHFLKNRSVILLCHRCKNLYLDLCDGLTKVSS